MSLNELVRFLIKDLPTILFGLIILISVLLGILRGHHKSKVMFLHSLIIGGSFLVIYMLLMNSKSFDKFIVTSINTIMGENYIQSSMGVSNTCESFTQILIEYIPKMMNYGDSITIILKDNGVYLAALVNLVYHLIFFVLFFVLYLIIKLIVSIIYVLIYNEHKYSIKKNIEFSTYKTDVGYKRRTIRGGLIGLGRGLITSLILFSMIGGTLYSVTGGLGEGDLDDLSIGDETIDPYLDLYKEINNYGSSGIFKVLNTVKDTKDVPLYLYVADLIFRGGYKDEEVDANLNLRHELSNLTSFSKDSVKLMIKYGQDDIKDVILGNITDPDKEMDIVVNVLKNQEFQLELFQLFDKFDTDSYVFNFALSLVDSIVANIDSLDIVADEDSKELLKILFKKDYKSKVIPYENKMINDKSKQVLPYIKPSALLKRSDVNIIFNLVINQITKTSEDDSYINFIYDIQQLSILHTNRKNEINPVLGRLYAYIESTMLSEEYVQTVNLGNNYDDYYHDFLYYQEVDWIGELTSLIDNYQSIEVLQRNLPQTDDFMEGFMVLFDPKDVHYYENKEAYGKIKKYLTDSKLVGKLLASRYVYSQIENGLKELMPSMYFKPDLVFENKFASDGSIEKRGELSNLLNILEFFLQPENVDLFNRIFEENNFDMETIRTLVSHLNSYDENGVYYRDYVVESDLIRSLLSSALIEYSENLIYVPDASKDKDYKGNIVNVINQNDLNDLFNKLDTIIDLISPLIENPEDINNIDKLLQDYRLPSCLENPVIEASIANQIISNLNNNEMIDLPDTLNDPNNWISVNEKGELEHIIDSINILSINISDILNGTIDGEYLVNRIRNLSNDEINQFLDSKILLSTVSDFIVNSENFTSVKIIVPISSLNVDNSINKETLVNLMDTLKVIPLDVFNENDPSKLLTTLINNKEILLNNEIIVTTVIYNLQDQLPPELKLTPKLKNDASLNSLKSYGNSNSWYSELPALFDVIESFFMPYGYVDINNGLKDIQMNLINDYDKLTSNGETYLDVLYKSKIITSNVTDILDNMVVNLISKDTKQVWKDTDGYYKKNEISSILDLARSLNVNDLNYIDFDNINFSSNETKDAIQNSYLIRAVISNQLEPLYRDDILFKNSRAYDSNNILKANEILSFVTILDGQSLNNFNINNINISLFKDLLYKDGKTESYILASTISNYVMQINELAIPSRIYNNDMIAPQELSNLIHSLELFLGKENNFRIGDIDINNISIPTDTRIASELIKSDIVNATIVKNLQFNGESLVLTESPRDIYNKDTTYHNGKGFIIRNGLVDVKTNSKIALFTSGEFESLIVAINNIGHLTGNLEFVIDAKKIEQTLNNKEMCTTILSSTFIHTYLSDLVSNAIDIFESTVHLTIPKGEGEPYKATAYKLSDMNTVSVKLYSIDFIRDTLIKYKELITLF